MRRAKLSRLLLLLGLACGVGLTSRAVSADEPAGASHAEAAELRKVAEDLGSDSFAERQAATRKLLSAGPEALAALDWVAETGNLEARTRAAFLKTLIGELLFEQRANKFTDDPGSDPEMPLWDEYRLHVGDGPHARKLFRQMLIAEPGVFRLLADEKDEEFAKRFARRCHELNQLLRTDPKKIDPAEPLLMLFLAGSRQFGLGKSQYSMLYTFANFGTIREQLRKQDDASQPVRRVVAFWLSKPDTQYITSRISLAMSYGFRTAVIPARFLLRQEKPTPSYLQYGFFAVGRFGTPHDLGLVEQHLTNETVLSTRIRHNSKQYSFQVRDAALAVLIRRSGQSLADYKLLALENSRYWFSPSRIGFESDADRAAAFEKWQTWRAAHPKFVPVAAPRPAAE